MNRKQQIPDQERRTRGAHANARKSAGAAERAAGHERKGGAPLEARILQQVEAMPPSERSVAELLLGHPGLLATHSATELAELAGASKAAVTRCIRRIGYASFAALRAEAREAQRWGSPLYIEAGTVRRTRSEAAPADPLGEHLRAELSNLDRSFAAIGQARFEAAAQAVAGARRVLVLGYRNSHVLAMHLAAVLGALRPGVELVPGAAGTLGESLVSLGRGDLLVAVGLRRRVPVFGRALKLVQAQGARVLAVVDATAGAQASAATWTLRVHCSGTSLFDSYGAAFSVANYLLALVAAQCGEPARARLLEIERLHGALDELA